MSDISLERISDTLSVYQQKGVFCYGTDAVLLSSYVKSLITLENKKAIDLCSGTGIIPFMLLDSSEKLTFSAVEINKDACDIANKSANYNNFRERYFQIQSNLTEVRDYFDAESFDFLTCNPPYMTANCGKMCTEDYKTIARHEIHCTIDDIFKSAFYLLKTGASAFFVYRPDRLSSLFSAARNNRFEIKRITFVHSKESSPPVLVLCEAKKDAKEGLVISKPYIIGNNHESF